WQGTVLSTVGFSVAPVYVARTCRLSSSLWRASSVNATESVRLMFNWPKIAVWTTSSTELHMNRGTPGTKLVGHGVQELSYCQPQFRTAPMGPTPNGLLNCSSVWRSFRYSPTSHSRRLPSGEIRLNSCDQVRMPGPSCQP